MVSVIIPTYNRGKHLPHVTKCLVDCLKMTYGVFEVIFVDDGSTDDSQKVLKDLCEQYVEVVAIIMAHNSGQQNATLAGIRHAKHHVVLTMDDDLRYGLTGIDELVETLNEGYDVVYGIPCIDNLSGVRSIGTWFKEVVFRSFCHKPKDVKLTSFRALKGPVIDYIKEDQSMNVYISARTLQYTDRIGNIGVKCNESLGLPTNYTFKRLVNLLVQVLRNYSSLGLKLKLNRHGQQYTIKEIYS